MAGEHDVARKCEDAWAGVIASLQGSDLADVTVHKGFGGADIEAPALTILARTGAPEIVGETVTGNWTVEMELTLVSYKARGRTAHAADEAALQDILMRHDIPTQIGSLAGSADVADFQCFDWTPGGFERRVEDERFETEMRGTMYCCVEDAS